MCVVYCFLEFISAVGLTGMFRSRGKTVMGVARLVCQKKNR